MNITEGREELLKDLQLIKEAVKKNNSILKSVSLSEGLKSTGLMTHRAVLRRKSHYAVMDLRLNPGAVRLLQASCRSGLSTVLAFAADVAPHHRFVPDECVFSCHFKICRMVSSSSMKAIISIFPLHFGHTRGSV